MEGDVEHFERGEGGTRMKRGNTGLFGGWKDVFAFTYQQGTKGAGFVATTFGIAFLFLLAFLVANVVMGYQSTKGVKPSPIETVYVHDESGLQGLDFGGYIGGMEEGAEAFKDVRFETVADGGLDGMKEDVREAVAASGKAVGLHVTNVESRYRMELWVPENGGVTDANGEKLLNVLVGAVEQGKWQNADIAIEKLLVATAPVRTEMVDAGEKAESAAETLVKLLVPMVLCLVMYIMLMVHGQSIGQIVMVERGSKTMELLLTTIRPYPVIFGKILAVVSIAVLQTAVWIVSGVAGFLIGDQMAMGMVEGSGGYDNVIKEVVGLMRDSTNGQAFTAGAIVLTLLVVCFGFLFYAVLAGLIASHIGRSEELAQGMGIYQLFVIASFLLAYMGPVDEAGTMAEVVRGIAPYVPFLSVLYLPGELLVGNTALVKGGIGLAIIVVATFGLVIWTGKVYKDKVFHKGETAGKRLMRRFAKNS